MEPAVVSSTVSISVQRSYIKINTLHRKNPTEINGALSEFCGDFTVDRSMVSRCANLFVVVVWACTITQGQEGREDQQMKEVWSLWQMLLKKIVVQHVKNFLLPQEQKLRRKMHNKWPQFFVAGSLIHHDNARPHIADVVTKKLCDYGWEVLPHALYSPDMSPPDFHLFPKLKQPMPGRCFPSLEELPTDGTPNNSTHE